MAYSNIITYCLLVAGTILLLFSLFSLKSMLPIMNIIHRKQQWKKIAFLVVIFICGYIATLFILLLKVQIIWMFLIGSIFFTGSLFVYFIINNSKKTIEELIYVKNEKDQAQDHLKYFVEKYSRLFQNSSDVLFILNKDYEFLTVNNSIRKILGYSPEETIGKKILQLVFNADGHNSIDRDVIANNLRELIIGKKPVIFKTGFMHKYNPEPVYLQVKLEQIEFTSYFEIIGKASEIVDDILIDAFQAETQSYVISNQLSMAEHMSQRICRNLTKYISDIEANRIRICVREMLINAIEHGNLGITFEEKTAAMMKDDYYNFILLRSKEPQYKSKKILIEYTLTKDHLEISIEDSGEGFNHTEFALENSPKNLSLSHGRGIMLALKEFTKVTYNQKGNKVTLSKIWR